MQPLTATILASFVFSEFLNITQLLFVGISFFGIYLARINLPKK
jgi:drug/metabolite transporter (DMT)-like permease